MRLKVPGALLLGSGCLVLMVGSLGGSMYVLFAEPDAVRALAEKVGR